MLVPASSSVVSAKVHPVVIYNICDAYVRRNTDQERVIGTLLGSVVDGVAEIRDCFAVIHSEQDGEVSPALFGILHSYVRLCIGGGS
jgi:translation initiation factor 3 subunit F